MLSHDTGGGRSPESQRNRSGIARNRSFLGIPNLSKAEGEGCHTFCDKPKVRESVCWKRPDSVAIPLRFRAIPAILSLLSFSPNSGLNPCPWLLKGMSFLELIPGSWRIGI